MPETKAAAVRAHLAEMYPDKNLPFNVMPSLAVRFGLSRQRIQRIVAGGGYTVDRPKAVKYVRVCASCGKCTTGNGQTNKDGLCSDCAKVPTACENCGKVTYRYKAQVLKVFTAKNIEKRERMGYPLYRGHFYCSRQCSGKVLGKEFGWPSPTHPAQKRKAARAALQS